MSIGKKIIVILGPTASGKSDAAIKLAQKFHGEIISADSRQIYRGMDIGTGKVTGSLEPVILSDSPLGEKSKDLMFFSEGIPHHLIDVADPNDEFNVSHFKKSTEKIIEDILKKKKLPIICGGTGFWIKAIVDNIQLPEVKPNWELRKKLEKESAEELFKKLKKLDPERAGNIDPKNKVRLIRAIEICETLGKVPPLPLTPSTFKREDWDRVEFLQIGLDISREILNEKIKKRLDQRLENGMVEEIKNLHNLPNNKSVSWERLEYFGLEYRWVARFLQNKISFEEMRNKLYLDIIHYAKRQMTWFKKDKRILWLKSFKEIEKEVKKFIKAV